MVTKLNIGYAAITTIRVKLEINGYPIVSVNIPAAKISTTIQDNKTLGMKRPEATANRISAAIATVMLLVLISAKSIKLTMVIAIKKIVNVPNLIIFIRFITCSSQSVVSVYNSFNRVIYY